MWRSGFGKEEKDKFCMVWKRSILSGGENKSDKLEEVVVEEDEVVEEWLWELM